MSDEQKIDEELDADDDVEAHKKGNTGGAGFTDDGDDDGDDVVAHRKGTTGT